MQREVQSAHRLFNSGLTPAPRTPEQDQAGSKPPKARVAILTNMVAPYRMPVYRYLARFFQIHVFTSGLEANRSNWITAGQVEGLSIRQSWGVVLTRTEKRNAQTYYYNFLHITPGYFLDLLRTKPDAVISNETGFRTTVAMIYGALCRKPVWVWWGGTIHTERRIGKIKRIWRTFMARLVRHWISYGASSSEYLLHLGVPPRRITQIQNCVDESSFVRPAVPALDLYPKPVLLCVGQMVGLKGVERLLRGAAGLQREGYTFTLLLVGDGPEKAALEQLSRTLQLRNVQFHAAEPHEQMPSFYRSADCLVFPTLDDVWGLVVNEALWSGLPVIGSVYAGCSRELLPPENLFDPLDDQDLANALRRAVEKRIAPPDMRRLKPCAQVAQMIVNDIREALKS